MFDNLNHEEYLTWGLNYLFQQRSCIQKKKAYCRYLDECIGENVSIHCSKFIFSLAGYFWNYSPASSWTGYTFFPLENENLNRFVSIVFVKFTIKKGKEIVVEGLKGSFTIFFIFGQDSYFG